MTTENCNLAYTCCQRWASDRSRLALYHEDAQGIRQAHGFWDIQRAANRLSNALGALGTLRNDRVAIVLPQRPETGVAHIACYQMGVTAVPLSPLLSPEKLAEQLIQAEARIALVDNLTLAQINALRPSLPKLRHLVGIDGQAASSTGRQAGVHDWHQLLEYASPRYPMQATATQAPALLIDTGKGQELLMHDCLAVRLPNFVRDHDDYPQDGDLFWSPVEWSTPAGLLGALLPAWSLGQPVLGYRGELDPEEACWLMASYAVRNTLLPPGTLKDIMRAVPKPREKYGPDLSLRTLVTSEEVTDSALLNWMQTELGVGVRLADYR